MNLNEITRNLNNNNYIYSLSFKDKTGNVYSRERFIMAPVDFDRYLQKNIQHSISQISTCTNEDIFTTYCFDDEGNCSYKITRHYKFQITEVSYEVFKRSEYKKFLEEYYYQVLLVYENTDGKVSAMGVKEKARIAKLDEIFGADD